MLIFPAAAQDIAGIDNSKLCKSLLIEKFGEPTNYYRNVDDFGEVKECFYFGDDYIEMNDNHIVCYIINTPKIAVLEYLKSGGLKVGENLFKALASSRNVYTLYKDEYGKNRHSLRINQSDFPDKITTDDEGVILYMTYSEH